MLKRKIFVEKLIYFNLKYKKSYNYEIIANSSDDFSLKEGLLKIITLKQYLSKSYRDSSLLVFLV